MIRTVRALFIVNRYLVPGIYCIPGIIPIVRATGYRYVPALCKK